MASSVSGIKPDGACGSIGCDATAHLKCGQCSCALYCSAACQRAAWPGHRDRCKGWRETFDEKAREAALKVSTGAKNEWYSTHKDKPCVGRSFFAKEGVSTAAVLGQQAEVASTAKAFGSILCTLLAARYDDSQQCCLFAEEALRQLLRSPLSPAAAAYLSEAPCVAIHVAAERGLQGLPVLRWLLAHAPAAEATVTAPPPSHLISPLECAFHAGCPAAVDALYAAGCRLSASEASVLLADAAAEDAAVAPALVERLLAWGARADVASPRTDALPEAAAACAVGVSSRDDAARASALAVLASLLAAPGGDANARDKYGKTALEVGSAAALVARLARPAHILLLLPSLAVGGWRARRQHRCGERIAGGRRRPLPRTPCAGPASSGLRVRRMVRGSA